MNVCFVASSLGIGGLERVVTLVGESINNKENTVYYFSIDDKPPYWEINDPDRIYLQGSKLSKYTQLIMKASKSLEYIIRSGQFNINHYQKVFITNVIEYVNDKKINVLVLTSAHQIAAIPIIKKECKELKIVAWIHQSHQAIVKNSKKFSQNFFNGIELADKVVCLTDATTNYFSRINKKTIKIYNPVSIDGRNRISNLSSSNVSFVSRVSFENGEKGLDLLIKLAKKLPQNIYITIAGSGTRNDEKTFSQLISKNGLQKKIIWQGAKQGENLVKHYLDSTIFISTSRTEGFSLVILEAMSLGLPIISSPTTGARELLRDGEYGILTELDDIGNFAKIIEELMDDPSELVKLQKLSLQRAQDFNKHNIVSQWIEMITALLL
ncbi:glycosyltransferase [Leuconostoc mesenteroides]|uniref:glycosyltransferase n=1 Tax=Leuconostoc mesenteroides TaxID=1245 RepID=UPI0021D28362|nr:glycosyltransferase [Leuconostoc mesenteroides]MCU4664500.1 glycosyltransferase [Leuconostoc mesenteroides]